MPAPKRDAAGHDAELLINTSAPTGYPIISYEYAIVKKTRRAPVRQLTPREREACRGLLAVRGPRPPTWGGRDEARLDEASHLGPAW